MKIKVSKYLTVSVYSLIDETYKLIGRPIDDIATLVNNCDDKVWDIYANGLTTTINQTDSDMGKQLIMKYKPKSLAELSAWVAAIRPGFASLLKYFLERQDYSTGVKELDNLLSDSYHYMLYQENIMSFLVWLGVEEKGTYDIIKKIAKKKFKKEELDELKENLRVKWIENVGDDQHFEDNWQVVQDAASYSFNASHALSVAIDSLYGAYLKSHYPMEYFTVALSQYTGDMERTANLTRELPYFNISLQQARFGKSGPMYTMDKQNNLIYKGVASIKYCNYQIAEELMELSKNHYDSFLDLLKDIKEKTSVNSKQLNILIALNFFEEFGANKYLQMIVKMYEDIGTIKQIKKDNLEHLYHCWHITEDMLRQIGATETPKLFKNIDTQALMKFVIPEIPNVSLSVADQIRFELENLEMIVYTNREMDEALYVVTDFRTFQNANKPYVQLYRLRDGEMISSKVKRVEIFQENPFKLHSIIRVPYFRRERKRVKNDDGQWVETNELTSYMENYEVIKY